MRNCYYWELKDKSSSGLRTFIFIDVKSASGQNLLKKHGVLVKIESKFSKAVCPFDIVVCKINKLDIGCFDSIMSMLREILDKEGIEEYKESLRMAIPNIFVMPE